MNKNKKNIIVAIIFLVVLSGVLAFIIFQNKIRQNDIYKIRKEILSMNNLPDNDELSKKINILSQKEKQLGLYLFDKNNPLEIIEFVEDLASLYSLKTDVKNVNVADGGIVLDANLIGSLENIRNFILGLENKKKEITIKNVRINKNSSEGEVSWSVYLNIVGKTK